MDLATLATCLSSSACLVTQATGGLIIGMLLFLVCYGFILIFDDLVKITWGPEFKSMGMPQTFQVPPLFIAGGLVPPFYLFVVGMAFIIGLALWLLIDRTRLGKTIRAAAVNP